MNGNAGAVIGVVADLEFGFGGDLFANAVGSVRRFALPSGAASNFGLSDADGGIAFDAANGRLWVTVANDLVAFDAGGTILQTIPGVANGPSGLTIDQSGDLLLLNRHKSGSSATDAQILRIDPTTGNVVTMLDIDPSFFARGIDVSSSNEIFLTLSGPDTSINEGYLYRVQPDGSGLTLIASGGIMNGIAIGPSSDGSGRESVFVAHSNQSEIIELQSSVVPEPPSFFSFLIAGAVVVVSLAARNRALRNVRESRREPR